MKKMDAIVAALTQQPQMLHQLYPRGVQRQLERIGQLGRAFTGAFGDVPCVVVSVPGRTEIGGNHTDHNHGCVLAGSVSLDTLAVAAPLPEGQVRVYSEGYPPLKMDLGDLAMREDEKNTSASLIRGIAQAMKQRGYAVGGFCACITSDVLGGSGLSSSAAYEVLIANLFSHLYNDGGLDAVQAAQIGQWAENRYFGKPSGLMDQMACSIGGAIAIDFKDPSQPVLQRMTLDLNRYHHALCIVDTHGDHADLTDDYAAIPAEMRAVANWLGHEVLRDCDEADFYACLPELRAAAGDRAVLRAKHFFDDNRRVGQQAQALRDGDFEAFLALVRASGASSFHYLQNVYSPGHPNEQAVSIALATAERLLGAKGAYRVHGGGFAGTIQAYVPLKMLAGFCQGMDAVLGAGSCLTLDIRSTGAVRIA